MQRAMSSTVSIVLVRLLHSAPHSIYNPPHIIHIIVVKCDIRLTESNEQSSDTVWNHCSFADPGFEVGYREIGFDIRNSLAGRTET